MIILVAFGICIALIVLLYFMLFLTAYIGAQIVTRTHVRPYPDTPQRWGLKPLRVSFPSRDKVMLSGWYFLAGEPRATVLLLHGFGGKPVGDGRGGKSRVLPWIKFFVDEHCSVFVFDFRGQGDSCRAHITFGKNEIYDAQGAVAFLKSIHAFSEPDLPLVLAGVSFGGAVAILAAPKIHEVRAVIAVSPYADLSLMIGDAIKTKWFGRIPGLSLLITTALHLVLGIPSSKLSPLRTAPLISPRFLAILSGTKDNVVPHSHSRRLYSVAREPKVIAEIPGGAHGLIFEDAPEGPRAQALRAAKTMLEEALRPLSQRYQI